MKDLMPLFENGTVKMLTINQVLAVIKNGNYKKSVEYIRNLYKGGQEDRALELRKQLPYVEISPIKKVDQKNQIRYESFPYQFIEVNNLTTYELDEYKKLLRRTSFVFAYFRNATGSGITVLVSIEQVRNKREIDPDIAPMAISTGFKGISKVKVWPTLAMRVSSDPNIFINPAPSKTFDLKRDREILKIANRIEIIGSPMDQPKLNFYHK